MKISAKRVLRWMALCLVLCALGWLGWEWYDNNVDRSGWREKDGVTMYADFHGKPVTGWLDLEEGRYYFDEDYALVTGWLTLDGSTYYLGDDGRMHTAWLDTDEGRYYLGNDGTMVTSWQEIDGARHYFHQDGTLGTGWLSEEEQTYYLDKNGSPVSGWQEIDALTYYFDENCHLLTGWQDIEENRYYFGDTGVLHTGWLETEEGKYYLLSDGTMAAGWQEIEEKRYYFAEDGRMHTGWLEQGEYRYYLHPEGHAAVGPTEIEGETLYFSPKGIWVLLVNPWNPLRADYEIDLVEIEDDWMVDRQAYEQLKIMFEAMREAGLYPYFTSTYRDLDTQRGIWKSYVNRYMAAGYDEATANALTADFVAVPGTSEHHTGLAMDIVGHDYFYGGHPGSTKEVQAWLAEHCWEYGFILRYTKEKQSITGFAPETWHFRYVGVEVSMDMKDTGLCLEEYLGATQND